MAKNSELEDNIAMACITVVAVFGLVSNGASLYITLTGSRFRNAFGILCTSFLICNLQAIFSLSTWCIIVLTVKSQNLSRSEFFFTRPVGIFVNGAYYASLFVHFFVAVNRFCAFVYATKYNQLWSESKAILAGVMSWVVGTTISMAHLYSKKFFEGDCSLIFNKNYSYRFSYSRSLAGKICSNTDASITVITVMSMACFDFITLTKILAYQRRIRANITTSTGEAVRARGILFFRQSCILGVIYISYTFILIIHPFVFTNKWVLFASTTVSWILVQSLDGMIFLMFNRNLICKKNSGTTVTTAPVTNWIQTTARQ
uniref:G_PROTEIN_RECEP_F1_2 domain-containing protein n=3 Tax=Wuchereria bancrofti TaxID=6293 RepID=A0AAF5PT32_WUCBA